MTTRVVMVCSTCQPRGPRPATAGNAALITMLGAQIANQSDETETLLNNRARLIDGMLLVDICRTSAVRRTSTRSQC